MTTHTITYQAADPKRNSNDGHEPELMTLALCVLCAVDTMLLFTERIDTHEHYEFDEHCSMCGQRIRASR